MKPNTIENTPASVDMTQVSKKASRRRLARDLNGIPAEFAELIDNDSKRIIRAVKYGFITLCPGHEEKYLFATNWELTIGIENKEPCGDGERGVFQTFVREGWLSRRFEPSTPPEFLAACERIRANREASR